MAPSAGGGAEFTGHTQARGAVNEVRQFARQRDGESIPVLIQAMVQPVCAGVAFSADPISGNRSTTIVTGSARLADRLEKSKSRPAKLVIGGGTMPVSERTSHATTQIFGLVLLTVAALAASILDLLFTESEGIFIPSAVIAGAVTWVVWRFDRTWATIIGIVGSLASTLGIFFLAFGVFHVFSPLDFILGLVLVFGFFISLVAGVMVLVARFRDKTAPVSEGRRFRRTVMGLTGLLAVVSIGGFVVTRSTVSETEAQGAVAIEMAKFEFEPSSTTVSQGQNLFVSNSDPFAHDLVIEEFNIDEYFGPGSEGIVDLGAVPPGTYTFICSLHTNPTTGEGMTGELTIES